MKKVITFLFVCSLILPAYAEQFRQFGTDLVNKQAVTMVRLEGNHVYIYTTGKKCTDIKHRTIYGRNKTFSEVREWLNQK